MKRRDLIRLSSLSASGMIIPVVRNRLGSPDVSAGT